MVIKVPKDPRLTKKKRIFAKEVAKGETPPKAAAKAYNTSSYGSAQSIGHQLIKDPSVQEAIKEYADRIPNDTLERVHMELIEKREVTTRYVRKTNDDGEVEVTQELVDLGPDTQAASKGLDMAYRLKGLYKDKPQSTVIVPIPIFAAVKKQEVPQQVVSQDITNDDDDM